MTEDLISPREFGTAFKGFLDHSMAHAEPPDPPLRARLHDHFRTDPAALAVVGDQFDGYDQANVHLAIDAWVGSEGRDAELVGVRSGPMPRPLGLADLALKPRPGGVMPQALEGPTERVTVGVGFEDTVACVQSGLYLARDGEQRVALFVRGPDDFGNPFARKVRVDVMADAEETATQVLGTLRRWVRERSVHRGKVLSLEVKMPTGVVDVRFHRFPAIDRDEIVLPAGVLERIERHTIGAAEQAPRLLRAGRHLRRGLLLHGPPGTGKTFTVMYLASRMAGRTVLVVTGRGMGLVERAAAMARLLQPAMVLLEDVDLIAEERTQQGTGPNTILFELLNQMDGLGEDCDVIFVLTTNRPELLEPALASRPGRIDLAIELPLPDATGRARLLERYGAGLDLGGIDTESVVERTEGVSAAFIKELLRKAALAAALEDHHSEPIALAPRHLDEALGELVSGGHLTHALLGARPHRATC